MAKAVPFVAIVEKPKCNKANMRKFIAALKSGKYKQTHGRLRRGNKYCCLGVACSISKVGRWIDIQSGSNCWYVTGADDYERNVLPSAVCRWLGIASDNPTVDKARNTATTCNDVLKLSFVEIAELFEEKYL